MLHELRVRQLGVIEDLALVLGPGMTALTGETGAGKTLVVEALQLLLGARADAFLVRPGAAEATVEGRFSFAVPHGEGDEEVVLRRAVPAEGKSRGYIDGSMAAAAALAERAQALVDLHGQHSQQSLLSGGAQRSALDRFASTASLLAQRAEAHQAVKQVESLMAEVGGDPAARAREMEFLHYQLGELERAAIVGPGEDEELAAEQDVLAGAATYRQAAELAYQELAEEQGALDRLGQSVSRLSGQGPWGKERERLRDLASELADAAAELRRRAEDLEDDPARLEEVVRRRLLLGELRRKYAGPGGDLAAVVDFQEAAAARLAHLEGLEGAAAELSERHRVALARLDVASRALGQARRTAAAGLGRAVERNLARLAMPKARFEVSVGGDADGAGRLGQAHQAALAGEEVTFLLAANPGSPLLPLAKVASGGELARAMLALRLALLGAGPGPAAGGRAAAADGPFTLVFDEVDAGVGGEAALAVGRALSELSRAYQVLVVTHLPQVAAFAHHQVVVRKEQSQGSTRSVASQVEGQDRVTELARMLSGRPGSQTGRHHAAELLALATKAGKSKKGLRIS